MRPTTDIQRTVAPFRVVSDFEPSGDQPTAIAELARRLRGIGARAGIAVKPDTPIEPLLELLPEFDQVLVMTVEPGFGGQSFIEATMPKLRSLADAVAKSGLDIWLQVDGGINQDTIEIAAAAGANTFVAGSSVFGSPDRAAQIDLLRQAASAHSH